MMRRKTIRELRDEIIASPRLKERSQEEIATTVGVNQATLSRILRGRFKRVSGAVDRVCTYARILRMTDRPLAEIDASLAQLKGLARGRTTRERHALKLIRLAAELLEAEPSPRAPERRRRAAS
jgi:transcriptional regulator with XRE-family HTH domain